MPKQFRMLNGKPIVLYSMQAFRDADPSTRIVLVVHPEWTELLRDLLARQKDVPEYELTTGGSSRVESVMCGLRLLGAPQRDSLVAVHDAARPLVSTEMIWRGWEMACLSGAAVPVVPVTDSLRMLVENGSMHADRANYRVVQTPQVFSHERLAKSYSQVQGRILSRFTDDASVVEFFGHHVALYEGETENIKVTNPMDFIVAEALLSQRNG